MFSVAAVGFSSAGAVPLFVGDHVEQGSVPALSGSERNCSTLGEGAGLVEQRVLDVGAGCENEPVVGVDPNLSTAADLDRDGSVDLEGEGRRDASLAVEDLGSGEVGAEFHLVIFLFKRSGRRARRRGQRLRLAARCGEPER